MDEVKFFECHRCWRRGPTPEAIDHRGCPGDVEVVEVVIPARDDTEHGPLFRPPT